MYEIWKLRNYWWLCPFWRVGWDRWL